MEKHADDGTFAPRVRGAGKRNIGDTVVRRYLERMISLRDESTMLHSARVAQFAKVIGRELHCTPRELRAIYVGSVLHDIGKIGIPDAVLRKDGTYDDDDRRAMRGHCEAGFSILRGSVLHDAALVALCHHEQFDGSGYPNNIAGDRIPFSARVCAVADSFDAATAGLEGADRLSMHEAATLIASQAGTVFDPIVVDAFLRAYDNSVFDILARNDVLGMRTLGDVTHNVMQRDRTHLRNV